MKEGLTLLEFVKVEVKNAGAMAINNSQTKTLLGSQDQGQGFQVKAAVDEKLGIGKLRWQVEFTPEIAAAASKYHLGGLTPLPCGKEIENPLEIGPGRAIA